MVPVGVFVHYSGYHLFPLLALGTMLLVGVFVGRLFCGWVCPFGFIQDLLYKIPSPKFNLPKRASWGKYFILAFSVFLIPFFLGEETWYSFCRACPASALQVTIPHIVISGFGKLSVPNMVKLGVLAAVLLLAFASSRSFCKALCPIGAILAPLNHFSFWKVKPDFDTCISCKKCDAACPTDARPSERIAAGVPANRAADCIVCHECASVCPKK